MAHSYMTSADILNVNNSEELLGLINEASGAFPEWEMIPAGSIPKTTYKTLVMTALPTTGFRTANVGIENSTPTLTSREASCKFFDASWILDVLIAKECEWGRDYACALQAKAHLESAIKNIATQTWYGTSANASGFTGVASLFPYSDSDRVVNAGGTTAGTGSSVFAVRFDPTACRYAWGNDASLEEGDIKTQVMKDENGKNYNAFTQQIDGWVGLQIADHKAFGRICNLTEDAGKGLTDGLIAKLLATFPVGRKPQALFMTQRSLEQLRSSRTATNATGTEAPIPTEVFGVPIVPTDAISNTETLLADEA